MSRLYPTVNIWFVGTLGYKPAYRLQELLAARHFKKIVNKPSDESQANTLIIVEHPPVYTIGIRTSGYPPSEEERLKSLGAEFYRTNRGGLVTFHGPGQLVAYPILNLADFTKSMKWYLCKLEETVIRTCSNSFGIEAGRSPDTGVWVGNNKICAMGVHGSRYVTTHGLALNCNVDLNWFNHVVPCGIPDKGVTSLSAVLERPVSIREALNPFLKEFSSQFQCSLVPLCSAIKKEMSTLLEKEGLIDSFTANQLIQSK